MQSYAKLCRKQKHHHLISFFDQNKKEPDHTQTIISNIIRLHSHGDKKVTFAGTQT